ncbi:MAG: hypothetical protein NZ896_06400, partial [Nitrososphaerales archaeon]|nr:hypothetical protein [Nitrososphaerales archaeon]
IYKPVQGTIFNPASQWIIPILKRAGVLGIGQSSWGPSVYGFVESEDKAFTILKKVEEKVRGKAESFITKVDNLGARFEIL